MITIKNYTSKMRDIRKIVNHWKHHDILFQWLLRMYNETGFLLKSDNALVFLLFITYC